MHNYIAYTSHQRPLCKSRDLSSRPFIAQRSPRESLPTPEKQGQISCCRTRATLTDIVSIYIKIAFLACRIIQKKPQSMLVKISNNVGHLGPKWAASFQPSKSVCASVAGMSLLLD